MKVCILCGSHILLSSQGFQLLSTTQRISFSLYHKSCKTILQDVSMLQQTRGNGPFQMELLMKWQDTRCH